MKQYIKEKQSYKYSREDQSFLHYKNVLLIMAFYRIIREGVIPFIKEEIFLIEALLPTLLILACVLLCYGGYYIGEHFIARNLYKKEECLIDGMLLGLLLPIKTPIWLILVVVFLTIFIGRYFYSNIPIGMPSLIGLLGAIGLSIWLQISNLNNTMIDTILFEFTESYQLKNISFIDIWFGNVNSFISKTSPILCILGFLYLRKNIKWRIPIYYVGTCLLLFILSNYFIVNPWNDIIKWICSGNLLFLILFCAADKRTTPVTDGGQILFSLFSGIITYMGSFFFTPFVSVILALLLSNFLTPLFDYFGNYYGLKYCSEFHN